jgi:hypothetical protein
MLANKKSETAEYCVGRNFGQVLTIRGIETGITAGPATGRTLLKTDTKSGSSEAEDQLAKILLVEYRNRRTIVNVRVNISPKIRPQAAPNTTPWGKTLGQTESIGTQAHRSVFLQREQPAGFAPTFCMALSVRE